MPDINKNTFGNYAERIREYAEELTRKVIRLQAEFAKKLAGDPNQAMRLRRELMRDIEEYFGIFYASSSSEIIRNLPRSYLRGIQEINSQVKGLGYNIGGGVDVPPTILWRGYRKFASSSGPASSIARKILGKYADRHLTTYQVFEAAAQRQLEGMRPPVIRSAADGLRQIAIESGRQEYLEANKFTRRKMSQDILNRMADRGLTGVVYSDGRRISADAYAEMVSRTQTANASRTGAMNRQRQYGLDLVRISSHSPCSDLCLPWQGRVYSLSGKSRQYPPLSEAIAGGLYHPNCKHSQSAYIPGVTRSLKNPGKFADDARANRRAYRIEQKQRYYERQVRQWKRRKDAAITNDALRKAEDKISAYQGKLRELVDEHDYLRRKYTRESITATGRRTAGNG